MANNPNPADQDSFKPISLVPNYRALELIQENRSEIDTIVAESQFFKSIATGEQYRNFKSTLYDVETYINQTNEGKPPMNREKALAMAEKLKSTYDFSNEEMIMFLNQQPTTEPTLELEFPRLSLKHDGASLLKEFEGDK